VPRESGLYCFRCDRQTLHKQTGGVNHVLHFLVAFFTCGLWLIVWMIIAQRAAAADFVCTFCGTTYEHDRATSVWRQRHGAAAESGHTAP